MSLTVSIEEAQSDLRGLLARVKAGEVEVIIAEEGRPVARLLPAEEATTRRVPGYDAGKIWMAPDFDAPLPEDILRDFEGDA